MANDIFNSLLRERIDIFRACFSALSKELFFDQTMGRLRHAGEFGMYREAIVRDFLKFIIPQNYEVSSGFIITSDNQVSTQVDIIIYDSTLTPLYQSGDLRRFFPIESVCCIGEIKSALSKSEFASALNKLAKVKSLSESCNGRIRRGSYSPGTIADTTCNPYDLVTSFLLCQKLDFITDNVVVELDSIYPNEVELRHRHNLILSVDDGIVGYKNTDSVESPLTYEMLLPFPTLNGDVFRNCFVRPNENKYAHFMHFYSDIHLLTANKSIFYPDTSSTM